MAKLQVYKFVNPGTAASASPVVTAARNQTLATNRLGATLTSIGSIVTDLEKIAIAQIKNDKLRVQAERRAERRRLDAAAEERVEADKALKSKKRKPKGELGQKLKAGAKTGLGWIDNFLGPIGNFLLRLATFAVVTEVLEWMQDPENVEKLTTFLEKTQFVFDKIVGFGQSISDAIGDGLDFIFGKETTIEERLEAFGKIALAIGGIAGMLTAASGLRDLLDAGETAEDLLPDGRRPQGDTPERPRRPTPTNPSGANPDAPGPRGRVRVSDIAEEFGGAAGRQYKKILAEYGDDAARAYANALQNAGGNPAKALQAWKRLKLKPLPKPRPNALQRFGNFLGGLGQGALEQGTRLRNFATDQGGRLIRSLQGLPGWAATQYNNLSAAARKKWDDVSRVGQMIAEKGNKWASAAGNKLKAAGNWVVDGGKAALDGLASGAKNFFLEKIMTPLKPIIDPIAKMASKIGQGLFDMLMKIPGADKILEVLKKKGINGMGDIATAGSKLGKRAAAILPVIGGIVNLAFAYDRAANGDSIGALIEGTSGILDIAGLATAGAGSVVSMLLDGYMFARDFIPQLQQGEEAVVDAVGARGLKTSIDNVLSKLPNIGEIINMFMGKSNETPDTDAQEEPDQPLFLGGVVKSVSKAVGGVGKAVSGAVGGIGKTVGNIVSNPLVQTAASFIPGAAPIMAGIGMASNMMQGNFNPMGMLSSAAGMIPGLGGMMGGIGNAISGALNSPLGQIGQSFLSGGLGGAFSTGLGMIPGIGDLAQRFNIGGVMNAVMGGDYGGAMKQVASEMGVDPVVLGIVEKTSTQALSKGGISAEYAMQQAMEFVPVPMIIEKLVPIPQAVPINTGGGVVTAAPTSLTSRMQ